VDREYTLAGFRWKMTRLRVNWRCAMRTRLPVALVAVTLLMLAAWRAPLVLAQGASGTRTLPPTVLDPQAACHEQNYGLMNVVKGAQIYEKERIEKAVTGDVLVFT
jgi:hypothetical protein